MKQQEIIIDHKVEGMAIPIKEITAAISKMTYASDISVMFKMLLLTGCRISELDSLRIRNLFDNTFYFIPGKNQKRKPRKVVLPREYIKELVEYRKTNRVYSDRMFHISNVTFRKYFNRDIRPQIKSWLVLKISARNGNLCTEYRYQLKGLRKTYSSTYFKEQYDKWGDANVALEVTSKHMKHSSTHMTAYHYIEEMNTIKGYKLEASKEEQKCLLDY
jgi:integrase